MATSVATTFHSAADGEQFTAAAFRLGGGSHSTVVNDGTDALKSRSGILPGAGTPLDVVQLVSPGRAVTVKKGTVAQQSSNATGGVYFHSLTADTQLDHDTADTVNPRLDVIVATVFDDGTSASNTKIEILKGSPAASPSLPSALSSPPANTHYFPLAQVRVNANATQILTSHITKPVFGSLTMGQFTCAPGGSIRGITRTWSFSRTTDDAVGPGVTNGNTMSVTVPSAEALPGVYMVRVNACYRLTGGSGTNDCRVKLVTPGRTTTRFFREATGAHFQVDTSDTYVHQSGPGTALTFSLNFENNSGTNSLSTIGADPNAVMVVTRMPDL